MYRSFWSKLENFLDEEKRLFLGQVIRFGLTGGFTTFLNAAIYYGGAKWGHMAPLFSNFIGYLVAMFVGYMLHNYFSFRGHGCQDRHWQLFLRFCLASLLGLGLNSFWVEFMVNYLHLMKWTPLPFMIFVTPLVSFWLNRRWVFRPSLKNRG